MNDHDDEFANLLAAQNAASEQIASAMASLAKLLVSFRVQLICGGYDPEQAYELTRDYFAALLDAGLAGQGESSDG
jgi:hypothetical protein